MSSDDFFPSILSVQENKQINQITGIEFEYNITEKKQHLKTPVRT